MVTYRERQAEIRNREYEKQLMSEQKRIANIICNLAIVQGCPINATRLQEKLKKVKTNKQLLMFFRPIVELYDSYLSKLFQGIQYFRLRIALYKLHNIDELVKFHAKVHALLSEEPPRRQSPHSIYTIEANTDGIDDYILEEYGECVRKDYINKHWYDCKAPNSSVYIKRSK